MEKLFPKIGSILKLSQEISNIIEDAILQKKIQQGEKLPTEAELCNMFGVSRTAVREAFQMLAARGLVRVRKGDGIYVSDYSPENVTKPMSLFLELNLSKNYMLHVMEIRKMLEPQIARLAALRRTDEDLDDLSKNLEKHKRCKKDDSYTQGKIDGEFHLKIANACKNPIVSMAVKPVFELMPKTRSIVYAYIDTSQSEAIEYHSKILEMIKDGNADVSYETMKEHLKMAESRTLTVLNKLEEIDEIKYRDLGVFK